MNDLYYPTPGNQYLLNLVLLPDSEAGSSWQAWRTEFRLQDIDFSSLQLFPLVYYRLRTLAPDDPLLPRIRGIAKRTWFSNQFLLYRIGEILKDLDCAGIVWAGIKGAGILPYYDNPLAERPLRDFDILVRKQQLWDALQVLKRRNWSPSPWYTHDYVYTLRDTEHAWGFRQGQDNLDLHWHAVHQDLSVGSDDAVFTHSRTSTLPSLSYPVSSPTDQLLHVCVHGARWETVQKTLWVVDLARLLNRADEQIDWDRLWHECRRRYLTAYVSACLGYLRDKFRIDTQEAHRFYPGNAYGSVERLELRYVTTPPGQTGPLARQASRFLRERRCFGDVSGPRTRTKTWCFGFIYIQRSIKAGLRSGMRELVTSLWPLKRRLNGAYFKRFVLSERARFDAPVIAMGQPVRFHDGGDGASFLVSGWSGAEATHTWSDRAVARIGIALSPDRVDGCLLVLDLALYIPAHRSRNSVDIWLNGVLTHREHRTSDGVQPLLLAVPACRIPGDRKLTLDFEVAKTGNPAREGRGTDSRSLGVRLDSLTCKSLPDLELDMSVDFSTESESVHYLSHGWSHQEPDGIWSVATHAEILVPITDDLLQTARFLTISLTPYLPTAGCSQVLHVQGDFPCQTRKLTYTGRQPVFLRLPELRAPGQGVYHLRLSVDKLRKPSEFTDSDDTRELGIKIHNLRLTANTEYQ